MTITVADQAIETGAFTETRMKENDMTEMIMKIFMIDHQENMLHTLVDIEKKMYKAFEEV